MNLEESINTVNSKFTYTTDPRSFFTDYWFVMKDKEGKMHGDCDDYSITVLWLFCGGILSFIWNVLILHRFRLHRVKAISNEYHVVAEVNGMWFDNWTMRACTKEEFFKATQHQYQMMYLSPIIIWFMVWGYLREYN